MNIRIPGDFVRNATLVIRGIRHATTAASPARPAVQKRSKIDPEHGRQIYVYKHLQKNHVVYSLSKAMKNNPAISQIPFNGKKTVPRALRKDHWYPMAIISFPEGENAIGVSAFQKLREYRRRHELEWDDSMLKDSDGDFIPRKKRGRLLMDQRANSVADMAAVLGRLAEQPVTDEERIGIQGEGKGARVVIQWGDVLDAEFAQAWSENVLHGTMEVTTNHRDGEKVWGKFKHVEGVRREREEMKRERYERRAERERMEKEERERMAREEGEENFKLMVIAAAASESGNVDVGG